MGLERRTALSVRALAVPEGLGSSQIRRFTTACTPAPAACFTGTVCVCACEGFVAQTEENKDKSERKEDIKVNTAHPPFVSFLVEMQDA